MIALTLFFQSTFAQEKKSFSLFNEFFVSVNSSVSFNFENQLGFSTGFYSKPVKGKRFSFLLGLEYFNSSLIVKDANPDKYSDIENGKYQFHVISFPFVLRHKFLNNKVLFEYGLKLDYDLYSHFTRANQKVRFNWVLNPSLHLAGGYILKTDRNSFIIKVGTGLTKVLREDLMSRKKVRYSNVFLSLAYVLV